MTDMCETEESEFINIDNIYYKLVYTMHNEVGKTVVQYKSSNIKLLRYLQNISYIMSDNGISPPLYTSVYNNDDVYSLELVYPQFVYSEKVINKFRTLPLSSDTNLEISFTVNPNNHVLYLRKKGVI
jgi:hypothetical protein